MNNEQWNVTIHSDNLDAERIKRVITMNEAKYTRHDFIQCYAHSADFNVSSGHGFSVYISFPAEVMDRICEEWQRFRRDLAAHEQQKGTSNV